MRRRVLAHHWKINSVCCMKAGIFLLNFSSYYKVGFTVRVFGTPSQTKIYVHTFFLFSGNYTCIRYFCVYNATSILVVFDVNENGSGINRWMHFTLKMKQFLLLQVYYETALFTKFQIFISIHKSIMLLEILTTF